MGDEHVGQAELGLQILQQIHHLRLDRHVQRRDRLVADDQLRVDGERAGDADALALAAGEFVRIAHHVPGRQADHLQQLLDPRALFLAVCDAVHLQRLGDDVADRHARIERRIGILEDDLDLPADHPHLPPLQGGDVGAVEFDAARGRLDQPHDQAAGGGFAAARFADHGQRLALIDVEADIIDRLHGADLALQHDSLGDREMLHQPFDFQDRLAGAGSALLVHLAPHRMVSSSGAFQQATL